MNELIEKYKKKIDDTMGPDEKKSEESRLFRKIVQKHDFLKTYQMHDDKHMVRLDKWLHDKIGLDE
jgi:hypothetical protein